MDLKKSTNTFWVRRAFAWEQNIGNPIYRLESDLNDLKIKVWGKKQCHGTCLYKYPSAESGIWLKQHRKIWSRSRVKFWNFLWPNSKFHSPQEGVYEWLTPQHLNIDWKICWIWIWIWLKFPKAQHCTSSEQEYFLSISATQFLPVDMELAREIVRPG